jgi:hypothetical protein
MPCGITSELQLIHVMCKHGFAPMVQGRELLQMLLLARLLPLLCKGAAAW